MVDEVAPTPRRRSRRLRTRLLGGGFALAVVIAVFAFFLPKIADYRSVWDVVQDLSWVDLAILAAATVLNLATFAPPWMAALPDLGFRQALALSQASTAVSIVSPAGAAVGMAGSFAMLRSWGFKSGPVGLAVALVGVWNQLANLTFPIVALALLTAENESHAGLRTTALVGVGVLVVVLAGFTFGISSSRRAHRVGELAARIVNRVRRLLRRDPVAWGGESFASFRRGTLDLLRRRWHVLTLATLAGNLTVFLVLLACIRTIGISTDEVTLVEAFAAWALVRVLGLVPLTPAGLGVVELGLSGALVAFGASNADAVAATLLYRFLTVVPTLVLGLAAAATWRTHARRSPV